MLMCSIAGPITPGATDTSFPGLVLAPDSMHLICLLVLHTRRTATSGAVGSFAAYEVREDLIMKIGDLDPIAVTTTLSRERVSQYINEDVPHVHIEERRYFEKDLLLGLDILLELYGSWGRCRKTEAYLHLESAFLEIQDSTVVSTPLHKRPLR